MVAQRHFWIEDEDVAGTARRGVEPPRSVRAKATANGVGANDHAYFGVAVVGADIQPVEALGGEVEVVSLGGTDRVARVGVAITDNKRAHRGAHKLNVWAKLNGLGEVERGR